MARLEDSYKNMRIDKAFYNESDYFDEKAPVLTNLNSAFQQYRISKVLEIYSPGQNDRVLDLGCGWGTFDFILAPSVKECIGLDFSHKSIEICNKILATKGINNVRFICANASETNLVSASFDVIISADLFEHIYPEDFEHVMDECQRLLKSGGKLVIWTPNRDHILEILKNHNIILKRDISHVDYKSMPRLIEACNNRGFKILKRYYAESHLPIVNIIERLTLRFLPITRRRIAILAEKL